MKIKISFDYDGTLTQKFVQEIAKELIASNYEVHLLTSRFGNMQRLKYPNLQSNEQLFRVAEEVGIPQHRISFTNQMPKWMVLNEGGIHIHLDDDKVEIDALNYYGIVKVFDATKPNLREQLFEYINALQAEF